MLVRVNRDERQLADLHSTPPFPLFSLTQLGKSSHRPALGSHFSMNE